MDNPILVTDLKSARKDVSIIDAEVLLDILGEISSQLSCKDTSKIYFSNVNYGNKRHFLNLVLFAYKINRYVALSKKIF